MLFSLLANLVISYYLFALPAPAVSFIDASQAVSQGQVFLNSRIYQTNEPYRNNNNSLGMKITATSAMVVDESTGLVLWQKNQDKVQPLASISKLITALVFLDNNPGWDKVMTINISDFRSGGKSHIYSGEEITVRDLFNLSLVASSNSATVVLARSTGLSPEEFVKKMNQKAEKLGMSQSHFVEPTGLSIEKISSATDIIKLAATAFSQAEIRQATIQSEYTFHILNNQRNETAKSTDKLLSSYLKINGGKTGYLDESGYCLTAEVNGNGNHRLLVVVLNSLSDTDRFQDLKALTQWTFDNYTWPFTD